MSDKIKKSDLDKKDKVILRQGGTDKINTVVFPHTLKVGLTDNSHYSATISGSIHHTHEGKSYLVAGNNITIASSSNGQVTVTANVDGDITSVTAGTGLTGGGDEGAVTLSTNDSEIVHDNLSGFVSNEHVDHSSVSITAGNGLTGGGDITTSRTIAVGAGTGIDVNASDIEFDADGGTLTTSNSDLDHFLINDGGAFKRITPGNVNISGFNNDAGYVTSAGSGTVTEVTVGSGLDVSSGTTTPNITLDLSDLTDMTSNVVGTQDELILLDNGQERRKLISEITLSDFDNDSGFTTTNGTVTEVTVGTGLDVSSGTTTPSITLDLSELTDMTSAVVGTQDELILLDNGQERRKLISEITLSDFDNDSGFVTENTMGSGFILEDGDGTEVTITENKEVKFVEGTGIEINWTDTSSGTDADPYDLTFTVDVSDFMTNGSNNRLVTATGTDGMNAEANLGFDGTSLTVIDSSGNLNIFTSGDTDDAASNPNIISWNSDSDVRVGTYPGVGTDIKTLIGVPGTEGGIGGGTKNVTVTGGDLVVSGTLKIQANSTSAEYTFPTSDGIGNRFLKTDGNGTLSFAMPATYVPLRSYFAFNDSRKISDTSDTEMGAPSLKNGKGYKMVVGGEVTHISIQFDVTSFTGADQLNVRLYKNGSDTGKFITSTSTTGIGDYSAGAEITAEAYNAGDTLTLALAHKSGRMTTDNHVALIRIVEDVS